jgi:N-acylglucosamine 2-epimerase
MERSATDLGLGEDRLEAYAGYYRRHLLAEIMPFWEARTRDEVYGGYLTCFDRQGELTGTDKYACCQGQQVWMFSALYNKIELRHSWLDLARHGREFLVERAHAGNGRWYYLLDRQGNVVVPELSLLTDGFALLALCEYALASGSDEDLGLIRLALESYERNFLNPEFDQYHPLVLNPRYLHLGPHMLTINVTAVAAQVLGRERVRRLADFCLERVLHVFARNEYQVLFDTVGRDGGLIDTPEGRTTNLGHALGSMWLCLCEARQRGDQSSVDRFVQICEWMLGKGSDHERGGILAFVDPEGEEPCVPQVLRGFGETWDTKIWWVHAESLYTLALAAYLGQGDDLWQAFHNLHDYCHRYFYDAGCGEWYTYLYGDGTVKVGDKGSMFKSAFHIPRALMRLALLFEEAAAEVQTVGEEPA